MKSPTLSKLVVLVILLLSLSACGGTNDAPPTPDSTQVYSQAAQTVAAQFTQTALAQPSATPFPTQAQPTEVVLVPATQTNIPPLGATLLPGVTASPTSLLFPPLASATGVLCNNSVWIADVGVEDGATLKVGQPFQKGWVLQNSGSCDWGLGYSLQRIGGNATFDTVPYVINNFNRVIYAGQFGEISLNMVAPKTPGSYDAAFQMYSKDNIPFGTGLSVSIVVKK